MTIIAAMQHAENQLRRTAGWLDGEDVLAGPDWGPATELELESTRLTIANSRQNLIKMLADRATGTPLTALHEHVLHAYEQLDKIEIWAVNQAKILTARQAFAIRRSCRHLDGRIADALHLTTGCDDNWCSRHEQCRSRCRSNAVTGACIVERSCSKGRTST